MAIFDLRTIIFSYVLTDIVSTLVIIMLWRQTRKRFQGTTLWVVNYSLQTTALSLIVLRDIIPDWISIDIANTLAVAGMLLGLIGLERFFGKKRSHLHSYVALATFAFIHTWLTFARPSLEARNLNASVFGLYFYLQYVWLMLYRIPHSLRKLTYNIGIIFCAYSLVNIIRIIEFFTQNHSATDYFNSDPFETIVMISYQMLFILLTYSLVLMFNRRLLMEIATEEEKFFKAFHTSHSAITLSRLSDGKIIEVNDGFQNITGYKLSEVKGKTSINLQLWEKEEDRENAIDKLSKDRKIHGKEYKFRVESGQLITGLYSAEIININNEECILSTINDITERNRAGEALRESETRYHSLFNEMLESFALHEIICDENGKPIDYRFLEINPSFEKQTGLKAIDIIGKTMLQVLPNIESSWIERYGKVALTGEPAVFENYTKEFDRHYHVVVFSPKTGQFATLFEDITERKIIEKEILDLNNELEKRVLERTKELELKNIELAKMNRLFVGRELRMAELKVKIKYLENKLKDQIL